MATIIIHGTMTTRASPAYSWWWNSRGSRGFLEGVSRGLKEAGDVDDVWRAGGSKVSEIAGLQGGRRQFLAHQGHFQWSGLNQGNMRRGAGRELARYLNVVQDLEPRRPIRVVAHSHGCNVVKAASADRKLSRGVRFGRSAFLACPHFVARAAFMGKYPYRLNSRLFSPRSVLNLYSGTDSIQDGLAEQLPSVWGGGLHEGFAPEGFRVDQDPSAEALYVDREIETEDQGKDAHSALHGNLVGRIVGQWLAGWDYGRIEGNLGRHVRVRAGDHGS